MPKANKPERRWTDTGVILVGSLLAGAAAVFAGTMVYNGPLLPGRDFSLINLAASRQNTGTPLGGNEDLADPIVTGSIDAAPIIDSPAQVPEWFRQPGRKINYRLRSAGQSSALVDVSSGTDMFIYKVEPGGLLPGLGRVRAIGREAGRWQIVTARTRISNNGAELMREQDAGKGTKASQ